MHGRTCRVDDEAVDLPRVDAAVVGHLRRPHVQKSGARVKRHLVWQTVSGDGACKQY